MKQIRMKTAYLLVGASFHDHTRKHDDVLDRECLYQRPMHARVRKFQVRYVDPRSVTVDVEYATKGCSDIRMAPGDDLERVIKAWRDHVVAVQDMHPMTSRPLHACRKICLRAHVLRLSEVRNSRIIKLRSDRRGVANR